MPKKSTALFLILLILFFSGCTQTDTGKAIKSLDTKTTEPTTIEPECIPSTEICDGLDNDCDKQTDEENVCEKQKVVLSEIERVYHPLIQKEFRETVEEHQTRIKNYQKYLEGDTSIKEQDFIAKTRWAGPKGTKPMNYEEYTKNRKVQPFNIQKAFDSGEKNKSNLIYVVVDAGVYYELEQELQTFVFDLQNEGYSVELYFGTFGAPEDLKNFLEQGLPELQGAIFVGDIPTAWFLDMQSFEEFPLDLFYMDLDGTWTDFESDGIYDEHSGNTEAEIWIGRIDATTLEGNIIDLYKNYFYKNHLYRTQNLKLPNRSLVYVDNDWQYWAEEWNQDMQELYKYTTKVKDKNGTNELDYKTRLLWNYDWISVFVHSWPRGHIFESESNRDVSSEDIQNIDPHALFYNLFACSAAKFTEQNYLAGRYLFADTYGVGVISSTKSGSMLDFNYFYGPLGERQTLGEAFKFWFNEIGINNMTWHYGMELLGDPTLKPNKPNELPVSHMNLEDYGTLRETNSINGTAKKGELPFSTFDNYVISIGGGLNPIEWKTEGIELNDEGLIEIDDSVLGQIDSTRNKDGLYVLKLTVDDGNILQTNYKTVLFLDNADINLSKRFFKLEETVQINGSAIGSHFSNYIIEWGIGEEPNEWFTTGINLENNGQSPVIDSLLGTLDTSGMNDYNYTYTLKLKVFHKDGLVNEEKETIIVDPDYKQGWPKKMEFGMINVHPVLVADITGDEKKEIIFQEIEKENWSLLTHALNIYGEDIEGWPLSNKEESELNKFSLRIKTVPSVDDLDNDETKEIIFNSYNELACVSSEGTVLWQNWIANYHFNPESVPIITDLDNDGLKEIIILAFPLCGNNSCGTKDKIYVFNHDGSLKWIATIPAIGFQSPPAVGDITGDGHKEIFLYGNNYSLDRRELHLFNSDGNELNGWPIIKEEENNGTFALADLDKDNTMEILYADKNQSDANYQKWTTKIHAINSAGNEINGWPAIINSSAYIFSLIPFDLDNDGFLEVFVSTYNNYIFDYMGKIIEEYHLPASFYYNEPVTGDIDNDNQKEIFNVNIYGLKDKKFYGIHKNGSYIINWPKIIDSYKIQDWYPWDYTMYITPIFDDIDNDRKIDIVLATDEYIYVWEFDANYTEFSSDWQMYRNNPQHTGAYTKPFLCGDPNNDKKVNIIDVSYLINYIFNEGPAPKCNPITVCADPNQNQKVNIADLVYLINYIFNEGPAPCEMPEEYKETNTTGWTKQDAEEYLNKAMQNS